MNDIHSKMLRKEPTLKEDIPNGMRNFNSCFQSLTVLTFSFFYISKPINPSILLDFKDSEFVTHNLINFFAYFSLHFQFLFLDYP